MLTDPKGLPLDRKASRRIIYDAGANKKNTSAKAEVLNYNIDEVYKKLYLWLLEKLY